MYTVLHFIYDDKYKEVDDKLFLEFIKKAFSQPRKKLVKNLSIAWFDTNKINEFFNEKWLNPDSRPEDLWVQDFIDLYNKILIKDTIHIKKWVKYVFSPYTLARFWF